MADDQDPCHEDQQETDFDHMSTTCPRCGGRMRPVDLGSGAVVLRCPRCGQTVI